ncbi:MAG: hypothetical protein OEZ68_18285 [Gammaproteobacteria bacterium]|nr:hypothetical protein [Gammaproteobacteria bacterium]MDH5802755.1 hypothetical protein [Gammaproteobacteria bacterium]
MNALVKLSGFQVFLVLVSLNCAVGAEMEMLSKLPNRLVDFHDKKVEKFDDARYGASAGYSYSDSKNLAHLTIILFDAGYGPIEDGIDSKITNRAFDAAIRDIEYYEQKAIYKNVRIEQRTKKRFTAKFNTLYAYLKYEVDTTGNYDYEEVESYLIMTGINKYMLKIRITGNHKKIDAVYISKLTEVILTHLSS